MLGSHLGLIFNGKFYGPFSPKINQTDIGSTILRCIITMGVCYPILKFYKYVRIYFEHYIVMCIFKETLPGLVLGFIWFGLMRPLMEKMRLVNA